MSKNNVTNLSPASLEVFKILQSFDYTVMLYGEDGNRVDEPSDARRMFARPENIMVSIIDDGDNSNIHLYIGNRTNIADILGLISSLKNTAVKFNLLFQVQKYNKEIKPKDFANVNENRIVYEQAYSIVDAIIRNIKINNLL